MTTSQLTSPTRQQNPLDAEDFRRLGVRPNEYRLSVIRNAAARSARPLADRQLNRPNEKTVHQLSKVVASAYRLMDPRKRQSSSQRAYVGRILPQALRVAGRTKFASKNQDLSDQEVAANPLGDNPLGDRQLLSDRQQTALVTEVDLHEGSKSNANPTKEFRWHLGLVDRDTPSGDHVWQTALQDDDLVSMTPATRKLRHVQRRIKKRWFAIVGVGLVTGAALGLLSMRAPNSEAVAKLPNTPLTDSPVTNPATDTPVPDTAAPPQRQADRLPPPVNDNAPNSDAPNDLPAKAVPTVENTSPQDSQPAAMQPTATPAESLATLDESESGLRGRLSIVVIDSDDSVSGLGSVAFEDAGVSLLYQPGVSVSPSMLGQFEQHLRRPLAGGTLTFRGAFKVADSCELDARHQVNSSGMQQQIILDGNPIDTAADFVAISAGTHEIEWQIIFLDDFEVEDSGSSDGLNLSLSTTSPLDPANWQSTSVFTLASDRDQVQPSDLKVTIAATAQ